MKQQVSDRLVYLMAFPIHNGKCKAKTDTHTPH
jgi:hypothetical protein